MRCFSREFVTTILMVFFYDVIDKRVVRVVVSDIRIHNIYNSSQGVESERHEEQRHYAYPLRLLQHPYP